MVALSALPSTSPRKMSFATAIATVLLASGGVLVACSSSGGADATAGGGGAGASGSGAPGGSSGAGPSGPASSGGSSSSSGGASSSGDTSSGGADAGTPGLLTIGRFDMSDPAHPAFSWPGTRIVARFDGTGASVKLTHTPGSASATGSTWVNVVVDGVAKPPVEVTGAAQTIDLTAGGLPAGVHTVEIEKRTEANVGALRLEGFTFTGGAGLLPPPNRPAHRIEFVSESTIDGFGVEGNGFDDPATCNNGAPSRYDNARKSLAFHTAEALSAEHHLIAFSGKGVARNNDGSTTETMAALWTRTLAENAASSWSFAEWKPEVVVISLGGSDFEHGGASGPADFQAKYGALVDDVRAKYGASPYVILLVWSQLKDYDGVRTAVSTALDGVVAARPAGERTSKLVLPEADHAFETGCFGHANDAHHAAMAQLLVAEIKAKTGW